MYKKSILLAVIFTVFSTNVIALQPPTEEQIQEYKTDGSYNKRVKDAKEFKNYEMHPSLVRKANEKIEKAYKKATGKDKKIKGAEDSIFPLYDGTATSTPSSFFLNQTNDYSYTSGSFTANSSLPSGGLSANPMPSTGTVKIPLILIDFPDYPHSYSKQYHENLVMGTNLSKSPHDSLKNYYLRASYNKLNIETHVYGWYRTSYNRSSISQNPISRDNVVLEALNYFNSQGANFAQYDNNGDGYIDYIPVIWAGDTGAWSSFWWSYSTGFNQVHYLDGKRLGRYVWQKESSTVTTLIHETGHALGLPDLYDYNRSVGPDGGVGNLDMMDANRGDFNPFFKWILGWTTPHIQGSGTRTYLLNPSGTSQSNNSVVIFPGANGSSYLKEFFVAQNRWRVGNDATWPHKNDGLLIWHIDGTIQGNQWKYNNHVTSHKLVRLMEADGLEEIEASDSSQADAEDYYVNGSCFSPYSWPNSRKYSGAHSSITIDNILRLSNQKISLEASILGEPCYEKPTDYVAYGARVNDSLTKTSQKIRLDFSVKNAGSLDGSYTTIRAYRSMDSTIDPSDYSSSSRTQGKLSGLESISSYSTIYTPSTEGTYWYGICTESGSSEPNYTNNCSKGQRVIVNNIAADIGQAVDNDKYIWRSGGDAVFNKKTIESYYGGDAAQSGVLGDSQQSWFEADFHGKGLLRFWWKASTEYYGDKVILSVNGQPVPGVELSGDTGWQKIEHKIKSEGTHTIRWTYIKNNSNAHNQDTVWVDRVEFVDDSSFFILPNPNGGAAVITF